MHRSTGRAGLKFFSMCRIEVTAQPEMIGYKK